MAEKRIRQDQRREHKTGEAKSSSGNHTRLRKPVQSDYNFDQDGNQRRELGSPVIAILCADLHLSHLKPSIRAETDWYAVQKQYLLQLENLRPTWDVPIICAGDIADRWNQPPEFLNFCLDYLPEMYSVFGNHDLPNHCEEEIHRSVFHTLVKIGKVKMLSETPTTFAWHWGDGTEPSRLFVYGFGWEKPVRPPLPTNDFPTVHLAVCHRYVWTPGHGYEGADEKDGYFKVIPEFDGYDAVLFGDNHKSWKAPMKDGTAFNPGTFLRRKADEINHKPCVGLLKADGSIERKYLDVSGDKFVDRPEQAERGGLDEFVARLRELGDSSLDFRAAINKAFDERKASKETRKLILEAME